MAVIANAVVFGMLVLLAGSIPRNLLFAANLRYSTGVPWAVPIMAVYLWGFWRYLRGDGPPESTRAIRRRSLRANSLPPRVWAWALLAGGLGIVGLVLALRLANRLVELPHQQVPDLSAVPAVTIWSLLLAGAAVAGIVEEAAFRGYMQGPIERHYGLIAAISISGTIFAVAHYQDFTLILWPYYVTVAAIYGTLTFLTGSIGPAIVLHTAGNIYSNSHLLLYGRAEWQASTGDTALVWQTGFDAAFLESIVALLIVAGAAVGAYARLGSVAREPRI